MNRIAVINKLKPTTAQKRNPSPGILRIVLSNLRRLTPTTKEKQKNEEMGQINLRRKKHER